MTSLGRHERKLLHDCIVTVYRCGGNLDDDERLKKFCRKIMKLCADPHYRPDLEELRSIRTEVLKR